MVALAAGGCSRCTITKHAEPSICSDFCSAAVVMAQGRSECSERRNLDTTLQLKSMSLQHLTGNYYTY